MFTTTREQLTSWKNDMQKYEKSKQKLSWKMPPPVKIVREWEVKSKDYEYNPILQKYNAPIAEQAAQRREAVTRVSEFAKSRAKSIKYERDYNIINFEDKPESKYTTASKKKGAEGGFQKKSKKTDSAEIENELPINNIERKPVNPPHEKKPRVPYSKRSVACSKRFNPLKVVNTDIRFIDNVFLSYNTHRDYLCRM